MAQPDTLAAQVDGEERDLYICPGYICPGGERLACTGTLDQGRILPYRASAKDCAA